MGKPSIEMGLIPAYCCWALVTMAVGMCLLSVQGFPHLPYFSVVNSPTTNDHKPRQCVNNTAIECIVVNGNDYRKCPLYAVVYKQEKDQAQSVGAAYISYKRVSL